MQEIFLLFPHQLFKDIAPLKDKTVYLIEEYLYFNQYKFHQTKLAYHRATMQYYVDYLATQKIKVNYVDAQTNSSDIRVFLAGIKKIQSITIYNTVDFNLQKRIFSEAEKKSIAITVLDTPQFMNTSKAIEDYFSTKKKYFQTDFYIQQRKQYNILVDGDGNPAGGKWSFDADNRLKYPKDKIPPSLKKIIPNKYWQEAVKYVQKNYTNNYGIINEKFIYAITHDEAQDWLNDFLQKRLDDFGTYEDAIVAKENILHHSVLTPMLNVGLLTPTQIINTTIVYASKKNIGLNNTEGFIRQIIGWREFIRGVYVYAGVKERTTNYWKFTKKIPASFYDGTTGILPVDDVIKKVLATGYCHHIERLMVLGSFMLLCEFHPDEVYRWFMELFIDAYDWVMVTNVYGMSQFADGGLMATKPYISGSNYIFKMSDYKKTNQANGWDAIWDGLFWRFMDKQRAFFLKNPRLGMLVKTFDKMPEEKRNNHLLLANNFLQKL